MSKAGSLDVASLRAAHGRFATGVAVVTACDTQGERHGITVNSFTSVSLDPPLVLYCLAREAFGFAAFAEAPAFAVNVLALEQKDLSDRFAREVRDAYPDLAVTTWATGSPVIEDSLAAFDCTREAVHDAGDHLIVVGRVERFALLREAEPLIYFRGAYGRLEVEP